jgi:hypothetical protein
MENPHKKHTQTPVLNVQIGGTDLSGVTTNPKEGGSGKAEQRTITLKELLVEKSLDAPDFFRIRYVSQDMGKRLDNDSIRHGSAVEIKIGWKETAALFMGEVSYINATFGSNTDSGLELSGYDHMHRLTRGNVSRTWGDGLNSNVRYPDVFKEVIEESKAREGAGADDLQVMASESEGEPPSVRYVPQIASNNYQFIRSLGADIDQAVDADTSNDDKMIQFRKVQIAQSDKDADFTVSFDKVTKSDEIFGDRVEFKVSTVRQVAKVVVRGWNPQSKKNIVGEATATTMDFGVTPGHQVAGQAYWSSSASGKVHTIVDHPVDSKEEADAVAQSVFDKLSMDFVHGEAEIMGDAAVVPGQTVCFKGYGKQFDGRYLVTGCTHSYMPGYENYVTRFSFSRNGAEDMVAGGA